MDNENERASVTLKNYWYSLRELTWMIVWKWLSEIIALSLLEFFFFHLGPISLFHFIKQMVRALHIYSLHSLYFRMIQKSRALGAQGSLLDPYL